MAEEDLAPGKSSVAVNNCIRQLSYCKNDIRDTVGIWGEVRTGWTSPLGTSLLCHRTSWNNSSVSEYVHALCLRFPYPSWHCQKMLKGSRKVSTFLFQTAQKSRCHKDLTFVFTSVLVHAPCSNSVGDTQAKLLKSVEVFLLTRGLRLVLWNSIFTGFLMTKGL